MPQVAHPQQWWHFAGPVPWMNSARVVLYEFCSGSKTSRLVDITRYYSISTKPLGENDFVNLDERERMRSSDLIRYQVGSRVASGIAPRGPDGRRRSPASGSHET